MDNPEKLAIQRTQDEDKQNKNTTPLYTQTKTHNSIGYNPSYKQLEIEKNRTSLISTIFCINSLYEVGQMFCPYFLSFLLKFTCTFNFIQREINSYLSLFIIINAIFDEFITCCVGV
jgi:hypothetical protein